MAIIKRQMTVEDFILVMKQNSEIYPYTDKELVEAANLNICTGTAETYVDDGEIVGVGGLRYMGVAEGWFMSIPERRKLKLFQFVVDEFKRVRKEKNLWRIFAESKISERFLFHLGFKHEPQFHTWTEAD